MTMTTKVKTKAAKQKKCVVCGALFVPFSSLHKVCQPECAIKLSQKVQAKRDVQRRKLARAQTQALRHKLETVPELTRKAQAAFNRFIRLRDRFLPCVSCGKPNDGTANTFDAGHYRSVGSAAHLRFDEANVHGQCKRCNQYLSGNIVNYRAGLVARIGANEVERLERDNSVRKWGKEDLRQLAATYRQKCRDLEKAA